MSYNTSKENIQKNFKKKSKYIKKNDLFEMGEEKISTIKEFLSFITGFNNYQEFLSTKFTELDSRFDLFGYKYKPDKIYILKRICLFFSKNNNNFDSNSININEDVNDLINKKMLHYNHFYKDILTLDGELKGFSNERKYSLKTDKGNNQLIILNDINTDNFNLFLNNLIKLNTEKNEESLICNISEVSFDNIDHDIYYGTDGFIDFKNKHIKNIGQSVESDIFDVVKSPQIKRKNLFIIVDSDFFQDSNGIASFVVYARTHFNLYIISTQEAFEKGNFLEIKNIFCNTYLRFVALNNTPFKSACSIFDLTLDYIKFNNIKERLKFKEKVYYMNENNGLIINPYSPNDLAFSKFSFVEKIV